MDFANAAIQHNSNGTNKTFTENGAIINETTEHPGLDVFNKLVRDETRNYKTGKTANTRQYNKHMQTQRTQPSKFIKMPNTLELETDISASAVEKYYGNLINTIKQKMIENPDNTDTQQLILDTFILPFYKRCFNKNIKNENDEIIKFTGEGERLIFYQMFIELMKHFPDIIPKLIPIIPQYGYWGDLFAIWQLVSYREWQNKLPTNFGNEYYIYVLYHVIQQIMNDNHSMLQNKKTISLLSKWVPREGSSKDKTCTININLTSDRHSSTSQFTYTIFTALSVLYKHKEEFNSAGSEDYYMEKIKCILSEEHNSNFNNARTRFRKQISKLNKYLDTFEIKACEDRWHEIQPNKIPSRAINKYQYAMLNEIKNTRLTTEQELTGNKYPDNPNRVVARSNFIDHIVNSKTIKVSGVEPHEIMSSIRSTSSTSQYLIAEKQWHSKIDEVFNIMVEKEGLDVNNPEALSKSRICNIIPMMDVSGSMLGIPMDVSVGLGLFIIGLQKRFGLQKQIAISFTETPRVFDLTNMTIKEQIKHLFNNVGYSTNFEIAIDLVLDAIKTSGEHKDLIVFTDGQFNDMHKSSSNYNNSWTTCHQRILQKVANLGLDKVPNIIYWNLRLNTPGVQTTSSMPGVQLLQGYSPAVLNFALYGDEYNETEIVVVNDDGVQQKVKVSSKTPYETYREAMDQECFDIIRNIVKTVMF